MSAYTDFMLGEEIIGIRDLARDFADKEVAPTAIEMDQKHEFPLAQMKKMG